MKKVLLIAYDFPPFNTGGSKRPFRFFKELNNQNLEIQVVTLSESTYSKDQLDFDKNKDLQKLEKW